MTDSLLSRIQIRHLKKKDLSALEWDGEYTHFRRSYANAFKRSRLGNSILWVAELPEKQSLIGQIFIQLTCDRPELADGHQRAYFYSFRVRPAYRGCGVGKMLLKTVETDLIQRKYIFLTCNVAKENRRARTLYEQHGYHIIAHEPGIWSYQDHKGIWHQVVEPAWRMEKMLLHRV